MNKPVPFQTGAKRQGWWPLFLKSYAPVLLTIVLFGGWLLVDLYQGFERLLHSTQQRAVQHSQIAAQSLRSQILATDYVLRDVLGRIDVQDLRYPDPDPSHAERMRKLLKEKADTVPDFFSMVLFDGSCTFTATATGQNTGAQSKQALCDARKAHQGTGPLATYVSAGMSASQRPVVVLSRHLRSGTGEFLGGVLGAVELSRAQHWFEALGTEPGASIAFLDNKQTLLVRHPLPPVSPDKPSSMLAVPEALLLGTASSAYASQLDVDGEERIFGFSTVEGFPFVVAYGVSKAQAIQEWRWRAGVLLAGFLMLVLVTLLATRTQWAMVRQREKLRSSEELFRMLAENMADVVWRTDAQLVFTYINAADQRIRGIAHAAVIGTSLWDNLTPQGKAILQSRLPQAGTNKTQGREGSTVKCELPMQKAGGGDIWIEMSIVPSLDSDGVVNGYQGVGRDVSGRRQHESELLQSQHQLEMRLHAVAEEKSALEALATLDPLTGLYNRRFLDAALPLEFARMEREGKQMALIMLDLDLFKKVNDRYGHAAGDDVLKALANLLKSSARESDLICRYGGEEFMVIMPRMSAHKAWEKVDAWRQQLEGMSIAHGDFVIRITMSAGIAVYPDHGTVLHQLVETADAMLYQSKREGRNRVTVCAP